MVPNNYETDLILPIIEKASELANVSYGISDDQTKRYLKIVGDHMRAIVFLISDGVIPSNVGRGYVVRRLIRRVVHTSRAPRILEELKREELRFVQTLERGEKLLEEKLADAISSAERNRTVPCLAAVRISEGSNVEILLNKTPFYAESGGKIGDHGFPYISEGENQPKAVVEIIDVQKSFGNIFVHKGTINKGVVEIGKQVEAAVNVKLRQRAQVHHTATHLLQAALKKVIGRETSQAGSLVAFDRLRFDFNFHRPLLDNELIDIELIINRWVEDAILLQTKVMPIADAKREGAIAMFGEKYGEEVGFTINTFDI
ncbi:unnamed protein product [Vicia faba]|uniref:alanine--tRNA ligase n=1 Tax=Vicia faba TaxID=3906 RepID=A0AAV1ALV4_VICFA|nr:unnamed protein product [Vicia faba]